MATLVALVGLQPAAVAVTAKTLARRQPLQQVALFHTSKTAPAAGRLQQFLATLQPAPRVSCRQVALSEADSSAPRVWEAMRALLANPGLAAPIYYDVSPGLNFQVAQIAYHLGQDPRLQPLYGTYKELVNLATGERWPKENLGLAPLLRLYNLKTKPPLNMMSAGLVAKAQLTIKLPDQELKFDHVQECRGHLHILKILLVNQARKSKNQQRELRQKVRQLIAMAEYLGRFGQLHPILTVVTNDSGVARRLQNYGIKCLCQSETNFQTLRPPGPKGLAHPDARTLINGWKQAIEEDPGSLVPDPEEPKLDLGVGPVELENHLLAGDYWQEPPLATALGHDPSATLVALCTHQPRQAIILVDKDTPWLQTIAARLAAQMGRLGVRQLTFWPVTLFGQLVDEKAFIARLTAASEVPWRLNITPGTKAQAWTLSLLARQYPDLELWSLHQGQRQAVPLAATAPIEPLPLRHPPILLEVACRRGPDFDYELTLPDLQARKDCLTRMMLIHSRLSAPSGFCLPSNFTWQPGAEITLDHTSGIRCLEIRDQGRRKIFKFLVRYRRQECEVEYPSYIGTGYWLEPLVAVAFLNASTSREPYVLEDLVTGLRLYQTKEKVKTPLVEMDVVLLWQHQYIAVSCKAGKIEETDRQEIITETRRTLGRFALPVLVRAGIPHARAKEVAEASIHREPLEIGFSLLKETEYLRDLIERALQAKRTTAPPPVSRDAP